MPILTSQQINNFFNIYSDTEITFTKEIIRATGLFPKEVHLKSVGHPIPCIIYSVSMISAKVIASISPVMFEQIRNSNNLVSLRFSFLKSDKANPISFFVAARITGYNPYSKDKPNLNYISLDFTQRPPDDLIAVLGEILEARSNSQKRREERIILNANAIKKMGISNKSHNVYIQGVPRQCIVRDLSFSGSKVIVAGVAKYLMEKEASLHLSTLEKGVLKIPGKVIRNEPVEGRKDLAAIALKYDDKQIPIEYKLMINEFLKLRKIEPLKE